MSSTARRRGRRSASTPTGSSCSPAPTRTRPKRQAGISFLLAEMSTPGITLRPIKLIDGGYEVNEVFFEDVRVPADQLVGEENHGWTYAKFLLGNERTGIARIGTTKLWLAQVKDRAAEIPRNGGDAARRSVVRGAARRGRKSSLLALELTQTARQRLGGRRQAQPRVVDPEAKRQPATAGRNRTPARGRRSGCAAVRCRWRDQRAGVGAARRTALPELSARHRSTAAPTRYNATSSRRRFWDCELTVDFDLTDEQQLLRDTTREVLARSYDIERLNEVSDTELGWSREVWKQLADVGILGLGLDPEESGQIEITTVMTEVGRRLAPEPVASAALIAGGLIAELGNDQQKQLLDDVASGDVLALAHTEPGMRSPSGRHHHPCGQRGRRLDSHRAQASGHGR